MENKICGIYCIENLINNKKYIGQSVNIINRKQNHFSKLKNGHHENLYLQRAYDKYGAENFIFYIVVQTIKDKELLNTLEIFYVKYFKTHISEGGYNFSFGGNASLRNMKHTKEAKEKISQSKRGKKRKPFSAEWRRKISENASKYRHKEETKKFLSESRMGPDNPFYNKKHSEETKRKMSEFHMGRQNSLGRVAPEEEREIRSYATQGEKRKKSSSKYVGVFWNKNENKWSSAIKKNQKIYNLGYFQTEEEAALAYNKKAIELYGENAKLNIIT